jgi:hypothetical protein
MKIEEKPMRFESLLNELIKDAHERGLNWARSSASLALTQPDRQVLEDIARALAQRAACTPFDPAANVEDKHAEDEHAKTVSDLGDAEMALTHALLTMRQREDERARLGRDGPPPQLPPWMTLGGTVLFATAFAIGIFDWVHERLPDPYLAGLVSLVPSVALGAFVVRSLTSPESPAGRKLGFLAGVGLSVATGILRFAFSPDEWLIALALTMIELFIVAFLDWHGGHLQWRHRQWSAERDGRARAGALLDAARQQHDRAAELVAQLKEKSAAHLQEVARRALLSEKASAVETAVTSAIVAGAHSGIAENQGLRRGVVPTASGRAVQ